LTGAKKRDKGRRLKTVFYVHSFKYFKQSRLLRCCSI